MCAGAVLLALAGSRVRPDRATPGAGGLQVPARDVVQWAMPDGTRTLIAVAPSRNALRFYAFGDGRPLALAGESPVAAPRFDHIRALALSGDLLFVVDGMPARIRALHLPDLAPSATLPLPVTWQPDDLGVRKRNRGYRLTLRMAPGASAGEEQVDWRPRGNMAGATR